MSGLSAIQSMDPYDFEQLVAKVWNAQGYETNVKQKSNDKAVDVEAISGNHKILIQAKRYSANNKISGPDVRHYATLYQQDETANQVIIVTTSSFTSQAKEIAAEQNVTLVDGHKFTDMMDDNNVSLSNRQNTESSKESDWTKKTVGNSSYEFPDNTSSFFAHNFDGPEDPKKSDTAQDFCDIIFELDSQEFLSDYFKVVPESSEKDSATDSTTTTNANISDDSKNGTIPSESTVTDGDVSVDSNVKNTDTSKSTTDERSYKYSTSSSDSPTSTKTSTESTANSSTSTKTSTESTANSSTSTKTSERADTDSEEEGREKRTQLEHTGPTSIDESDDNPENVENISKISTERDTSSDNTQKSAFENLGAIGLIIFVFSILHALLSWSFHSYQYGLVFFILLMILAGTIVRLVRKD